MLRQRVGSISKKPILRNSVMYASIFYIDIVNDYYTRMVIFMVGIYIYTYIYIKYVCIHTTIYGIWLALGCIFKRLPSCNWQAQRVMSPEAQGGCCSVWEGGGEGVIEG